MSTSSILVTVATSTQPLDPGKTSAGLKVDVTDASGAVQTKTLTGSETPPYTATFTVVDGAGSVTATALDVTGAPLANPIVQAYATQGTGTTFQAPTGIVITPA